MRQNGAVLHIQLHNIIKENSIFARISGTSERMQIPFSASMASTPTGNSQIAHNRYYYNTYVSVLSISIACLPKAISLSTSL